MYGNGKHVWRKRLKTLLVTFVGNSSTIQICLVRIRWIPGRQQRPFSPPLRVRCRNIFVLHGKIWSVCGHSVLTLTFYRQNQHYTIEDIIDHLAFCIRHDMSSKSFLQRYTQPRPSTAYPGQVISEHFCSCSDACFSYYSPSTGQSIAMNSWFHISDLVSSSVLTRQTIGA